MFRAYEERKGKEEGGEEEEGRGRMKEYS